MNLRRLTENWDRKIMFLSLAVLFGFASHLLWTLDQTTRTVTQQAAVTVSQTTQKLNATLDSLNHASSQLNAVLETVNRPCGGGHPCGTLADLAKTLGTVRLTSGQIEIAANHENRNLSKLDDQEATLFSDTHRLLDSGTTLLATTNSGIHQEFTSLNSATVHADELFTSPYLASTLKNVNQTTGNMAAATSDFQKKFHAFLYPAKCKGKLCWLKRTYEGVSVASKFSEPSYWGYEFFKAATQ